MEITEEEIIRLRRKAVDIRKKIIELTVIAGGGHLGGALSMTDIVVALYYNFMKYDPKNPHWSERDRFILSKGHGALALCPVLADVGFYPEELMNNFNGLDSPFGMHPDMNKIPGIEMSTGSLGHGLSVAVGAALAERLDKGKWRVFCLLGDGELNEGMVWEAAMSAKQFKLGNLVAIVDRNKFSLDGPTEEIMSIEPLADKWKAFGWNVVEIDGNDMKEIITALYSLPPSESEKPTCIIAHTIKGKGVSFMENKTEWHYGGLDDEKASEVINELEMAYPKPKEV
jgi:transketolase